MGSSGIGMLSYADLGPLPFYFLGTFMFCRKSRHLLHRTFLIPITLSLGDETGTKYFFFQEKEITTNQLGQRR